MVASLSSLRLPPTHVGIQSVTHVTIVAEAAMHWGRGGLPAVVRRLVYGRGFAAILDKPFPTTRGLEDGCVIVVSCQQRMLASIAPPGC
jgi:hypothetical protein